MVLYYDRPNGTIPDRKIVPDRHTALIAERELTNDQTGARYEVSRKRKQQGCIEFRFLHAFINFLLQVKTGTMPRL
jgi:hypothetical protein